MSKITTELQELLNAIYAAGLYPQDEDVSTLLHELFSDDKDHLYGKEKQAALKDFGYLHIESEGGGEGEGEYCYGIIKVGEQYLKAEWSYYSYEGCSFDYIESTIRVVTPSQRTITVYA